VLFEASPGKKLARSHPSISMEKKLEVLALLVTLALVGSLK
jgi:hypothetical protein